MFHSFLKQISSFQAFILFKIFLTTCFFSINSFAVLISQPSSYLKEETTQLKDGVEWTRLIYSDLFDTKQVINIVEIDLTKAQILPLHTQGCKRLSQIATKQKALAAINGTFFDSDCSSKNFLKINGTTHSKNIIRKKGSIALLINKKGKASMEIISAKADSKKAIHGIGGFPQLLSQGAVRLKPLENTDFFNDRHPRSAIAMTNSQHLAFITVDGRSQKSYGFTLLELATFLQEYGFIQAMNMDGGGSTTLWSNDFGTINSPSDFFGERPVSDGLGVF